MAGIELAYFAWEANVLPLNYTRIHDDLTKMQIITRPESSNEHKILATENTESTEKKNSKISVPCVAIFFDLITASY